MAQENSGPEPPSIMRGSARLFRDILTLKRTRAQGFRVGWGPGTATSEQAGRIVLD